MSLAVASSLVAAFGCAPKTIKLYESVPAARARGDVVRYAMTLLGKPYRNAAKGPDAFDCSGLSRVGHEVPQSDVTVGDLVMFRIKREYHVGIMINGLEFIHASKSRGVTIDNLDGRYWKRNLSHFRRVL
ncbi:MAG: NlpC/P60 family protein [Syntrophorhabdales bacterium]